MIKRPRGTNDIYGTEMKVLNHVYKTFRQVLNNYNYNEIITPTFESKDLFVRSVGETSDVVSKEMYDFQDKKGRDFVLRPEGTAGVVRAVIENKLYVQNNLPLKLFYIGSMYRYERPQAGRSRQFNQLGVEAFGADNIKQDSEVILMAMEILKELKLADKSMININYLVNGEQRVKYTNDLKTYLKTFDDLCDDCKSRIEKNPLRVLDCKIDGSKFVNAPNMIEYLDNDTKSRFDELVNLLKAMNFKVNVDSKLVRGLDYYTGMVFEIKYDSPKLNNQSTLIGGGRYNNLVKELDGPDIPAAGFGLGIERIMFTLIDENIDLGLTDELDMYVINLGGFDAKRMEFINSLRDAGIKTDYNLNNDSIKQGFKEAEKYNSKNVIVLGDNEIKDNKANIKNQTTGDQIEVKLTDIDNIKKIVKG